MPHEGYTLNCTRVFPVHYVKIFVSVIATGSNEPGRSLMHCMYLPRIKNKTLKRHRLKRSVVKNQGAIFSVIDPVLVSEYSVALYEYVSVIEKRLVEDRDFQNVPR